MKKIFLIAAIIFLQGTIMSLELIVTSSPWNFFSLEHSRRQSMLSRSQAYHYCETKFKFLECSLFYETDHAILCKPTNSLKDARVHLHSSFWLFAYILSVLPSFLPPPFMPLPSIFIPFPYPFFFTYLFLFLSLPSFLLHSLPLLFSLSSCLNYLFLDSYIRWYIS